MFALSEYALTPWRCIRNNTIKTPGGRRRQGGKQSTMRQFLKRCLIPDGGNNLGLSLKIAQLLDFDGNGINIYFPVCHTHCYLRAILQIQA